MNLLARDELAPMTPPKRLTLIAQIWDSLADDHVPLTGAQQNELERRLVGLAKERRDCITWDALKSELEQSCP